jgi:hypothetical protein
MRLYTVFEAIPSRLIGLATLLHAVDGKGYTRTEIIDLLQPAVLRRGANAEADMATKVIAAAIELGLVEECDDDRGERCVRLTREAIPPSDAEHDFWARWVARRVLHDLVDEEARRLATIFAWFMTVSVQDTPADRVSWKLRFERDGFDLQEFGLNPDARWDNLFDWARFVGLVWQTGTGRDAPDIVCDPAVLLGRFLDDLLPGDGEVPADEFRIRLGSMFPPLDGGWLLREVREAVAAARGTANGRSNRWSPAVGMALRELRDRGLIAYHCPDDQRNFLLFDDGERIAFVSRG